MIEATTQGEAIALADCTTYVVFRPARDTDSHTDWAVMSPLERDHAAPDWQTLQPGEGAPHSFWSEFNRTGEQRI